MTTAEILNTLATAATAVGVFLAFTQLRHTAQRSRTTFEDSLSGEYRSIMCQLPVEALLGQELKLDQDHAANLSTFYRYFDLSNEQAFLHSKGRVSRETWAEWREGITQNLALPAFRDAWNRCRGARPDCFDELAQIVAEHDRARSA